VDADDWSKVVLAVIPVVGAVAKLLRALLAGAAALVVSAWRSDGDVSPFLWAAAAVVAILGTVGLVQDATPRARDDAGRPIK
jgi:hypothetical protein